MLPSLRLVFRLMLSVAAHDAVCKAAAHPAHIEPLVRQLSDLRKTSMAILFVMWGLCIQAGRIEEVGWVIMLILLTSVVCSMYDGMDDETFQARVEAVGPAIFTLVNSLPGLAATVLLCREMILTSESPATGALLALLGLTPGLLQMLGGILLLYRKHLAADPISRGEVSPA